MKELFENYLPFYNMVLSSTIMSNSQSEAFRNDSKAIIDFIGKAFLLDNNFIQKATDVILNQLISLGLTTDQQAVYSGRKFGDSYEDTDSLFDIKGDVLTTLNAIGNKLPMASSWFDYSSYKTYQPNIRFYHINETSSTGELITTRQAGILRILGIGCEVNCTEAIKRFSQSAFWGDIPSMYYLAYAYKLAGDDVNSKIFYEVAHLSTKYLNAGYTVLPDEDKRNNSVEACDWYAIISSIKRDIVCNIERREPHSLIDFSFIEVITLDSLDYSSRMQITNNYEKKEWKTVTNSPVRKKMGFN